MARVREATDTSARERKLIAAQARSSRTAIKVRFKKVSYAPEIHNY